MQFVDRDHTGRERLTARSIEHCISCIVCYLPMMSYIKEATLGSIWDTCSAVMTVFAKRQVCHNTQ